MADAETQTQPITDGYLIIQPNTLVFYIDDSGDERLGDPADNFQVLFRDVGYPLAQYIDITTAG